ncbi:hypothetical protein C8F01DRAFT_1057403 [Mycena amicta]|nr:hypothetical protein C8F01DRAFT_1057403 [Mycena amicta]
MDVAPQPHRVEDLWFEDGNIVLQAGSAQYKVYRGTLSRQSPVFQDMLSFPQPADAELVDGCPLVRLPDPELEVTPFLKALFEPYYFPPFPARTTFEIMYCCLRLSHKYAVDRLRRIALVHFSSQFRTTLEEWDAAQWQLHKSDRPPSEITSWEFLHDGRSLVCCVQLAREVDALWTLPAILYSLATFLDEVGVNIFYGVEYEGIGGQMSRQDQEAFVAGLDKQIRAVVDVLAFLHQSPVGHCTTRLACASLLLSVASDVKDTRLENTRQPLDVWKDASWELLDDMCTSCFDALRSRYLVARQTVWDNIPEFYRLPCWEDLEGMRTAAIGDDLLL